MVPPSDEWGEMFPLDRNDPTFERDRHRVRAVVGGQLGQHVFHVRLDRLFGDRQVLGDAAVGVAAGGVVQHFHLARAQRPLAHVLRHKTLPFLIDLFRSDLGLVGFVMGTELFEEDALEDLNDALQALGRLDAEVVRLAGDWWNPQSSVWDAARFIRLVSD